MAKFIKTEGDFRIYELEQIECKFHCREYPTFVCWDKDHDDDGYMRRTCNESGTIEEMIAWCKEYSYR